MPNVLAIEPQLTFRDVTLGYVFGELFEGSGKSAIATAWGSFLSKRFRFLNLNLTWEGLNAWDTEWTTSLRVRRYSGSLDEEQTNEIRKKIDLIANLLRTEAGNSISMLRNDARKTTANHFRKLMSKSVHSQKSCSDWAFRRTKCWPHRRMAFRSSHRRKSSCENIIRHTEYIEISLSKCQWKFLIGDSLAEATYWETKVRRTSISLSSRTLSIRPRHWLIRCRRLKSPSE